MENVPDSKARARRRAVKAGIVGNVIEWYEFGLYGYFALTISQLFFPGSDPTASLLSVFAVFAVGFLVRPLGAMVFGHIGDRLGRRAALLTAVLMMSGATVVLGLLPTYASIGIWAPILLLVCRLVQGLSAGGENPGASIYVVEHSPVGWRGRYATVVPASVGLGITLSALVSLSVTSAVTDDQLISWGWRIPFLLAGPLGIAAILLRFKIGESPEFENVRAAGEVEKTPLRTAFRIAKKSMFVLFGWAMLNAVSFYILSGFTVSYMQGPGGFTYSTALIAMLIAMGIYTIVTPLAGWAVDTVGARPIAIASAVGMALIIVPAFRLLELHTLTAAIIALSLIALMISGIAAVSALAMVDLFPAHLRYSGSGVPYQISYSIFGGTAPYVATWMVSGGQTLAPAYYLLALSLIATVVACIGFGALGNRRASRPMTRAQTSVESGADMPATSKTLVG